MFEIFFPDETVSSTYDIDFEGLYEEGYRGILFIEWLIIVCNLDYRGI